MNDTYIVKKPVCACRTYWLFARVALEKVHVRKDFFERNGKFNRIN